MVAQLRTVSDADLAEEAAAPLSGNPFWRVLRPLTMIALGTLFLLAAILANGRPTVFSDTSDYYSQAHAIVRDAKSALFHGKPIVTHEMFNDHFMRDDQGDEEPIHNELGARSPYYGLFLYALHKAGTIWLMAAAQAAIVAASIYALMRLALPLARPWVYLATMALLAAGSPLPYIAGFAVPDALTGAAAIAGVTFLLFADRIGLLGRIALLALLAFTFNAHASHLLTGILMTVCGSLLLLFFKYDWRPLALRSGLIAACAAVAIAANAGYAFVTHLRSGDDLRSPPFMAIRVIADGPGRDYLRATCANDPKWALCRFRHLPLVNSNTLMWSDDPKFGVFNVSDYPTRYRMEREELPFVLSVIAFDPWGQLGASLKNWWLQYFSISLNEVLIDPYYYLKDSYWKTTHLTELIQNAGACHGHACRARIPEKVLRYSEWIIISLSALFLGWRLLQQDVRHAVARRSFDDPRVQAVLVVGLLLLATILNAGVCGVASGVFGRYQARIVWLIPLATMIVIGAWGLRPRPRPHLEVVHD